MLRVLRQSVASTKSAQFTRRPGLDRSERRDIRGGVPGTRQRSSPAKGKHVSRDRQPTPPSARDGGSPQGNTTTGCSSGPCQCGDVRWLDAQAYCGDNARLEANFAGNCPDGPATVEILHPTNGSVVATISATMTGGHVAAIWTTKAQTTNWRTDRHRFRVQAAGLTCTSSNEFTFRHRPTTAWININTTRPVAASCSPTPREVIFDAQLEASRVAQLLKLRAQGGTGVAAAVVTAFKLRAESQIETVWNTGFDNKKFHRHNCLRGEACDCTFDCCKVGFHVDVSFVDSGEHWLIKVIAQPNPANPSVTSWTLYNTSEWGYPPKSADTTYAHEAGHMIGHYDEYVTGCNDPSAAGTQYRQPAPVPATERNLMSHAGNTTLLNRHYRWLLKFLNDNSGGDPYDIIPSGP
jgi:hypothetical protein